MRQCQKCKVKKVSQVGRRGLAGDGGVGLWDLTAVMSSAGPGLAGWRWLWDCICGSAPRQTSTTGSVPVFSFCTSPFRELIGLRFLIFFYSWLSFLLQFISFKYGISIYSINTADNHFHFFQSPSLGIGVLLKRETSKGDLSLEHISLTGNSFEVT